MVLMDSGVRRGADVVKALAAGANAVSFGRTYFYGLAVGREQGAANASSLRSQNARHRLAWAR